ncbi:MAG: response regulator [Treponema sp.]|jgi:PAS domain S-box-containing protein|nr:response regulator [Treponema sp.]
MNEEERGYPQGFPGEGEDTQTADPKTAKDRWDDMETPVSPQLVRNLLAENKRLNRELRQAREALREINPLKKNPAGSEGADPVRGLEYEKKEKYLNLMLENTSNIIILLDKNGCFLYCSNTFLKFFNIDNFNLIKGRKFEQVYEGRADRELIEQTLEHFKRIRVEHKTIVDNIHIDFAKDGRYRNYSINSTPLIDNRGDFDGAVIIYQDITDLLRAESDERTKAMLDATPLACTFWDEQGNLVDCNQESLALFEVASKEEFFKKFNSFSPVFQSDGNFSIERMRTDREEALRTGRKEFEWLHRSARGTWLPSEVILVRVKWRDGYRVAGFTRDLRNLKASEDRVQAVLERSKELEVETETAKIASEAKSKFLASMSHEIRTPMNAIIGMSELMRTDNLDQTQRMFFTDIKQMSKALLQIINDILDISKIEAGRIDIFPVHFNLLELYDSICSMSLYSAQAKDLEWRASFDPEVPEIIVGDDVRIRQVITNIVNNAIKYTREGYVDFRVKKEIRKEEEYIAFIVKDTGIGIKKEDYPKLFNTFQQLDESRNRGIMGTGLGLSITKSFVEMMKGEIELESEYGKGSVFRVYLPLIPGDAGQVEKKYEQYRLRAKAETKILVVDDNTINLKVIQGFLGQHGISADIAESGVEAVKKIKAVPYDLVFMDYMMPGMDGIEATVRIREMDGGIYRGLPILALTASAVTGSREKFMEAGMNDFISKPIDAAELNRKLIKWLPPERILAIENISPAARQGKDEKKRKKLKTGKQSRGRSAAPEKRGVNFHIGLGIIGGDKKLYAQLIATFRKDHARDDQKIEKSLETGDIKTAYRLAHTLKSTAGLLGAAELRNISSEIEKALADEDDGKAKVFLPRLKEELAVVLKEFQKTDADVPAEGKVSDYPPPDKKAFTALYEKLSPLLRARNTECLDMLDDIKKVFLPQDGQGGKLAKQIEDFEFESAEETLEDIRKQVLKN